MLDTPRSASTVISLGPKFARGSALAFALALGACSSSPTPPVPPADDNGGSLAATLQIDPGETVGSFSYAITGPGGFSRSGLVDVSHSATLSVLVSGIPAGAGFTITVAASTDGGTTCGGSATFDVSAGKTTAVSLHVLCHEAVRTGSVLVNGTLNICPVLDAVSANPLDIAVGFPTMVSMSAHDSDSGPAALAYRW